MIQDTKTTVTLSWAEAMALRDMCAKHIKTHVDIIAYTKIADAVQRCDTKSRK